MPLWAVEGKVIFFAHVPKTGGLSMGEYLARRIGPPTIGGISRVGTGLIVPPIHFSAADLKIFLPSAVDYCFAMVRDPIARLTSEFRFQAGRSRTTRLGFSNWLRIMLKAARRDPRVYENHLRPQTDMVPDGAEVFRFEDGFEPVIRRLDAVLGNRRTDLAMPHVNQGLPGTIEMYRQDIELAETFYAADYTRFGYPLSDESGLDSDPYSGVRATLASMLAPMLVARERRRWVRLPAP